MIEEKFRIGLVSLTPPGVQLFGVFYVEGAPDDIEILPVVTLALVEEEAGDPGSRIIKSLCYSQEYGVDMYWWGNDEALGYLLEEEVPKAAQIFSREIARRKKKESETVGRVESAQNLEKMCKPRMKNEP